MRIVVTGATGFIGSAIVREAARQGLDVRAVTRRPDASSEVMLVQADLLYLGEAAAALVGADVVIHAAASANYAWDETVRMTENVLAAAAATGARRFVLLSSMSVIDYAARKSGDVIDELSTIDARATHRDRYAKAKLRQEELARAWANQNRTLVVLRPGAVVGPDRVWTPRLGVRLGRRRWIQIGKDALIPLIHVETCARLAVEAAVADHPPPLLHLLDSDPPTQQAYVQALVSKGRLRRPLMTVPYRPARALASIVWPPLRLLKLLNVRVPNALVPASLDARFGVFQFSNHKGRNFAPHLLGKSTLEQLE